ncbi:hypothetical protein DNHGIG_08880 [Collibacillus ludicampi]|uniref:PucR C-terminal helix-turn-helix domain-containing protein n=1 Tax=Collibacillus ludicampi TaxID=2771369 RepID=A0AAV4LCB3_9BACL|nr:helix-turn-helix domain-containing protein [Collibacillus ludicampi]GIM45339.1 hypothetical protein DNHGIG_08880 [Collibacillus ludicampi]
MHSGWLQELLQRVEHAVRVHEGPAPEQGGGFFWRESEWWVYDETIRSWKVLDTARLSPDAAELARFLIGWETGKGIRVSHLLRRLAMGVYEQNESLFLREAQAAGLMKDGMAAIACIRVWGDEVTDAYHVLQLVVADQEGAGVVEVAPGDFRVYFPLPYTREDVGKILERTAHAWLDTLSSELYLEGGVGWGTPCIAVKDLMQAEKEAQLALEAGLRFRPRERVYRYDRLGLVKLLSGIPQNVSEQFLQEVLPIETYRQLTWEMRETIFALVENGANIAETARALYLHRNSLIYRLEKTREITGLDMRNLEDMVTLWIALLLHQSLSLKENM